ncbi:hypothetical protein U0C82_13535 [Fulvimarina sp. 2208YS6-2-32]|uniref:Uncharacterized protein n=1 Tax=Fulvimarina uroteuthidis TaxID=3098149 RepID=A0ABU5I446_9HYPH|nr:hypothetical protein [Fulvimarina sp. 2208YS6-2-32]
MATTLGKSDFFREIERTKFLNTSEKQQSGFRLYNEMMKDEKFRRERIFLYSGMGGCVISFILLLVAMNFPH